MPQDLNPGDKVRLKANPSRVGIMGNEFEGSELRKRVLVTFLDGDEEFVLLEALEKVERQKEGPRTLLSKGKFGRQSDLRGAITYYRLTGRLANLIYSLNATNTDFYAYQFKPVLNFLDSPCRGILVADEVGLGKTIEAGLIWTELTARLDAKRLLVLCPAMLREKWQMELENRFGVKAEIADAKTILDKVRRLKGYPEQEFALIGSLQGIRPPRKWDVEDAPNRSNSAQLARYLDREVFEDEPFDLVIIDEAHYLRNRETQTHQLGRLIREVTHHLLLLSATPIQLKSSDLFFLLNLIDEDVFAMEEFFSITLKSNAPIVHLRDRVLKSPLSQREFLQALKDACSARFFEDNKQIEYLIENPPSEQELSEPAGRAAIADRLDRINPLAKVISRTRKRDVHERRVVRLPKAIEVEMTEIEREFYETVTQKVRSFCSRFDVPPGFILTIPQRQMSSCMAAAFSGWVNRSDFVDDSDELLYEAYGDNFDSGDSQGILISELSSIVSQVGSYGELREQDSKYKALRENLLKYWEERPDKKVILFAFYRKTLDYLRERLAEDGVQSIVLYGGMNKRAAIEQFRSDNNIRILLSSEVASEGVDLQFCSLVINYDLPWNPMKIEQRIGRIDRIGQEEERILIWNFVYADTIDQRVYLRLLDRLAIFEQALGNIEAVMGDKVKALTLELLTHHLSADEEIERIEQTRVAIENLQLQEEKLEKEATQLIAHGEFIQDKIQSAKEMGRYITGEDLLAYVKDYLESTFEGTRFIQKDHNSAMYELQLSTEARVKFQNYLKQQKWTGRTSILQHRKPVLLFENRVGNLVPKVERVTQGHPLVKFVVDHQKASAKGPRYHKVTAIKVSKQDVSTPRGDYLFMVFRWSFSGSREIEKLYYLASNLLTREILSPDNAESLVNNSAMKGQDWLGANNSVDLDVAISLFDTYRDKIEEPEFRKFRDTHQREDLDRISFMESQLNRHRKNQAEKLQQRIENLESTGSEKQKKIIPAIRGKLQILNERIDLKLEELKQKSQPKANDSFVCCGLIRVD
jgi:SNF2 family DNA or RNA helicase